MHCTYRPAAEHKEHKRAHADVLVGTHTRTCMPVGLQEENRTNVQAKMRA